MKEGIEERHVLGVWVARHNPLTGWPFLVPLTTGQGLFGNVASDHCVTNNDPLLLVSDYHGAMTRTVSCH